MGLFEITFILITLLAILGLGLATLGWKLILPIFLVWGTITAVLAQQDFFKVTDTFPPRIMLVLLPATFLAIFLFRKLKNRGKNIHLLLSISILRIPVEVTLHHLYTQGLIPELMTYSGWNFDILSGLSAVVLLFLSLSGKLTKTVLLIWNWVALFLLIFIVAIAVLSAPTPLQQLAFDQPNVAVLSFPYIWLPAIVVPIVFLSHFLIFKSARRMT